MEEEDAIVAKIKMKLTSRNRTPHHPSSGNSPHAAASPNTPSPVSPSQVDPLLYTKSSSVSSFDEYNNDNDVDNDNHRYYKRQRNKPSYAFAAIQCVHRIWYQWKLAKTPSKIATAILFILGIQHVLFGIWDQCFYRIGIVENSNSNKDHLKSTEEHFAVVINTYKRPDMLRQAVLHYADTCGKKYNVGQVFVVWAEQGVQVPTPDSFFDNHKTTSLRTAGSTATTTTTTTNRATVEVLQVSKDSLNSRFEPIPQLTTTAVFMVDDDIRVACPSLLMGFQAWKDHPQSMAGYYPRLSSPPIFDHPSHDDAATSNNRNLVYHAWPVVYWRQKLNFVLTKASFLHSKYLALYTNDDTFPREIKDHVDQHMNCEDIAMAMLVANYTKYQSSIENQKDSPALPVRPIYVEGKVSDLGLFGGISTGSGHMTTRSDCLTQLTAIFESKGWGSPLDRDFDLGTSSHIRHAPGFWWQSKPSNFFEWLAFANTFT